MGNYAINRQRIGIPRGERLAVFQLFTENLPDGVRFREATAIKTWKRLELQRYGIDIICAFATIYKPAVYSQSTIHAHQWILVRSTSLI